MKYSELSRLRKGNTFKVSGKYSKLSRLKKGNTFYKNIVDAEATEKGALSDKSARITFPISLSRHRLQKILYNKNNAEKVQNYDARTYHGFGCENNSAHTYHGTTLVINILSSPVGAQGVTNYNKLMVSNFGHKLWSVQFWNQITESKPQSQKELRISEECISPDQGSASYVGQCRALWEHGNQIF